ncbi:MAG: hypothetical protein K0R55_4663, partial [Sporomusa sp.]|nr:hypothetical protein [Sporomusa sp.]
QQIIFCVIKNDKVIALLIIECYNMKEKYVFKFGTEMPTRCFIIGLQL